MDADVTPRAVWELEQDLVRRVVEAVRATRIGQYVRNGKLTLFVQECEINDVVHLERDVTLAKRK